jgi:hypothetical protein
MRSTYGTVAGWGAALLALGLILIAYRPFTRTTGPLPFLLLVTAALILAGFAGVVWLAVRADRVGPQTRQPRRATAGVNTAAVVAIGLTGFALGWWVALFAVYPLLVVLWSVRGDRVPAGARPPDLTARPPDDPPLLVHDGESEHGLLATPLDQVIEEELGPPSPWVRRWSRAMVAGLVVRLLTRRRR